MSDLLTTPELKRATEPAKRWRNWWRAHPFAEFVDIHGRTARADAQGIVAHPAIWPTKEVAEAHALEAFDKLRAKGIEPGEYLGAFPIEERP